MQGQKTTEGKGAGGVEACQLGAVVVGIRTLAPEPYELIQPIDVLIRQENGQHIASFLEADIHASGDTAAEALRDLKGMILDTYDALSHQKEATLGPLMIQQRAVIRASVRKCAGGIRE